MNRIDTPPKADRAEIEDLFYREAQLLDSWKLDDWLGLLTEDCTYYVPPTDKPDADHRYALFLIADDPARLRERVIRLKDPNCHAEYPPSRTRRMVSNVIVTGVEGDTISAEANFVVYRFRRVEDIRVFVGRYFYRFRRTEAGLKIAERRAVLDHQELGLLGAVSFLL